jgi:hypothetical protein
MRGGGTVTFACDGTILLRNNLPTNVYPHPIPVTADTVLDGTGHQITISGTNTVEGMFYVSNNVTLALVNLTMANGFSTNRGGGGAICVQSGTVCATNCTFTGNTAMLSWPSTNFASQGGAILNCGGNLNLQNCLFSNNMAVGFYGYIWVGYSDVFVDSPYGLGGAIFNTGSLNADGCQFVQNWVAGVNGSAGVYNSPGGSGAAAWGGAIYSCGSLVISRSSFISNSAWGGCGGVGGPAHHEGDRGGNGGDGGDAYGSAICNDGTLLLQNSTVVANTAIAGLGGGGGYPFGSAGASGSAYGAICGAANLVNVTVALNNGGGIYGGSGINTLLFSNTPDGNDTFADPKLSPLADNGGPTLTMALLPGSPAIDAGSAVGAPATDQRGVARPQGPGVDIGAFEYQYIPVFTGTTIQNASNCQLQMAGLLPTHTFTLQVSSDLLNWSDVTNFVAGTNGLFQCVDPIPGDVEARFYRLKSDTP